MIRPEWTAEVDRERRKSAGFGSGMSPGQEILRRDCPGRSSIDATFSPDGRWLATASGVLSGPRPEQKDWISLWDLETGRGAVTPGGVVRDYPGV